MNRVNLLTTSMMTPMERAAGRFMRAPDHPAGGDGGAGATGADDSGGTGDNTGGNSGDSGASKEGEDNDGQPLELDQFWTGKAEEPTDEESETKVKEQSQAIGTELGTLIKSFKAPEVFTKEIADKIADGDLAGVNEAMAARDQALMNHSIVVTAKLLGGVIDRFSADIDKRIQQAFGNRDSDVALETHFPLAKDPAMYPMVKRVWDQALINAKGNKEQAIRQTKGMLAAFGERTSVREAAGDPTAGINTAASRSLVDSLLERDSGDSS